MNKLTTAALFFLAAGILTSVTILSVYQVLFAVPLVYYTVQAFKIHEAKLPKSAYWLLAFILIAFLSLLLNISLVPHPLKNFGRLKYFLFGVGGIYVFRVWAISSSVKTKRFLIHTFLLTIVIAGIYSIWEFVTTGVRAKSLTDTMRYGYGSAMILLTVLAAILKHFQIQKYVDRHFLIIAWIIGFVGMYVTYTRGALLGFLVGLPVTFYFHRPKLGFGIGIVALALIGVLGGFFLFGNVKQFEGSRFLMTKSNKGDEIRKSQWAAATIAIKEKPILGWGFSNFHSQLKRIKNQYDLPAKDYDDAHAHNLFLEVAAGTGLLGLAIFLGWIMSWAWEVFHSDPLTKILVIPFAVAWIVSSMFEVTFDANNASMIFFIYALSVKAKVNV